MCCGATRAVGRLPKSAILLGEDNGEPATYVKVNDAQLIPGAATGSQIYVRGSSVEQAIEDGLIEDVSVGASKRSRRKTIFRVTMPDGEKHDFKQFAPARSYSIRNGGKLEVVTEDPDA